MLGFRLKVSRRKLTKHRLRRWGRSGRWLGFLLGQGDPQDDVNQSTGPKEEKGREEPGPPHPGGNRGVRSEAAADAAEDTIRLRLGKVSQARIERHRRLHAEGNGNRGQDKLRRDC